MQGEYYGPVWKLLCALALGGENETSKSFVAYATQKHAGFSEAVNRVTRGFNSLSMKKKVVDVELFVEDIQLLKDLYYFMSFENSETVDTAIDMLKRVPLQSRYPDMDTDEEDEYKQPLSILEVCQEHDDLAQEHDDLAHVAAFTDYLRENEASVTKIAVNNMNTRKRRDLSEGVYQRKKRKADLQAAVAVTGLWEGQQCTTSHQTRKVFEGTFDPMVPDIFEHVLYPDDIGSPEFFDSISF